ncbi:apolipoprotein N-acyltransferase [Primorskyibacter sp. S187A]|uniref:apolipoprotein N-acyltransferase n=1 Tax=Primorskyibacter sp. S187A TaxID=3415130 RepID=UPI003C7BB925
MPETTAGRFLVRADRLCAFGFGAVMALGLAPFGLGPLAFLALIAAIWLGSKPENARRAALLGWLTGLGYFGAGLHWIVEPFLVEPAVTGWLAPFGLIGLAGGLALFWALAFWVAHRMRCGVLGLALSWALIETLRGFVLTGFPWALVSHIWSGGAVLHWGSIFGPYGLTLVTLVCAAAPLAAWSAWRTTPVPLAVGLCALFVLYGGGVWLGQGQTEIPTDAPVLRLVQPNAAQHEKWDPEMMPVFFNRMVGFSAQTPTPDLVIWPESALPMLLEDAEEALAFIAEQSGTQAAIGVQRRGDHPTLFFNSLVISDTTGSVRDVYDKHHLVPFGEYMPLPGFWRALGIATLAARTEFGYAPGPGPRVMDIEGVGLALPLICYEAVFPRYGRVSGERPDFLLQVTNDAWFGAAVGPWQHLEQARMRAIEQGLPLVRVANTGVSAVMDHKGRILGQIALNTSGYLDHPLPARGAPTIYARFGNIPAGIAFLVLALVAIGPVRRRLH